VTTYKLGMPAELRRRLEDSLPRELGKYRPQVLVIPRDRHELRCAAWESDHYELTAFYSPSDRDLLGPLEDALKAEPSVYLTTQVYGVPGQGNVFTNPDWPPALGTKRRDGNDLRAQVIALIRDEEK
jgi:hypothetical protein